MGHFHNSPNNFPFRNLSPFSRRFADMLDDMAFRLARLDSLYEPIVRTIHHAESGGGPGEGGTPSRSHVARIDAVIGGPNASYTATSLENPDVVVTDQSPINRILPPVEADIDFVPAEVGDMCWIIEFLDEQDEDILLLIVYEELDFTFCTPDSDPPPKPPKSQS